MKKNTCLKNGDDKMKKILSLALAAVLLLALAACGQSAAPATTAPAVTTAPPATAPSEPTATPDASGEIKTVTPGKLTVGTSPDFAPYEFYILESDGSLTMAGFDIDLAQAIADDLGLELEMKALAFDAILLELEMGSIDLGISGFSPDPERAKSVDFSDLYYLGGQSLVVRKADLEKYKTYESLKGLPVGAQNGSIQYDLALENTPESDIVGLETVTGIIMELKNMKLEAAFIETAVAENYIVMNPDLAIAFGVDYDVSGSAVAIKKGGDALTAAVNATIARILADGTMDGYIAKANELSLGDNVQEISVE